MLALYGEVVYPPCHISAAAAKMHISPYTVEDYRETLFKKFGLKNKTELILFALKHKLVEQGISNQPLAMSR
ncbi:hypothetical protein DC498_06035 [Terrimonas sp.]|nr:hypothetical protein DC498_06035 [Terrimonas sp.]